MSSQEAAVNSVAPEPKPTASDRCDCDWCEVDPRARAFFWRCYLGGLALLIAAVFLFT
jgi:hypothetical protein